VTIPSYEIKRVVEEVEHDFDRRAGRPRRSWWRRAPGSVPALSKKRAEGRKTRAAANRRAKREPGTRVPLHCSAVGKAMLSAASEKKLSKTLHQRGMPRLTVKTVTSPSALRADLERVRATGYAVDDEEHAVGLRCIAAPIFDETGDVVAAVSASGPMARISDERMAQLGALVLEASRAISRDMGASPARG
jgi:DNA-binding IclR family transcriptional regulator